MGQLSSTTILLVSSLGAGIVVAAVFHTDTFDSNASPLGTATPDAQGGEYPVNQGSARLAATDTPDTQNTASDAIASFAVSVARPNEIDMLRQTGVNIVVRNATYVIVTGDQAQIDDLRTRGYLIVPLQKPDVAPGNQLEFRVLVGHTDQLPEIVGTVSDLWPFGGASVPDWAYGRAYSYQLQLLRLRGFQVEVCNSGGICK